ncbi:MAG: BACON domain-containing protein [Tannerella sp.]|jgi:hypothetical protein|nr:BACON domain-containing protein [Tannerella sp.]
MKIIKNSYLYILLLCFLAVFNSCEEKIEKETLTVSTQEIVLDKSGLFEGTAPATFEVFTNSLSWRLVCASWLTPSAVTGASGNTEVSVTAGIAAEDREGYITITGGSQRVVIRVKQLAQEFTPTTLTVTPATLAVSSDGLLEDGNKPSITVSSNKDWSITGLPEWITASVLSGAAGTSNSVILTVSGHNDAFDDRAATFSVASGFSSVSVTLTQAKKIIPNGLPASWDLPLAGANNTTGMSDDFTDFVANDGSANLNVGEWWVKSVDGASILRAYRAGEPNDGTQRTMSYTSNNPADGDRLLIYGLRLNDYWQMEIPTTGLSAGTILKIEGAMQSSGTGPRDFLIQYSTDQTSWTPVNPITEGDITYTVRLGNAVRTPILETFIVQNAIPAGMLYIRLLITGPNSASGGANIGGAGTSRISRLHYDGEADKAPIMKVSITDELIAEGLPASWMIPAQTFTDGIASDGTANLNVNEWWVKSDDGYSIIRAHRAGETSNAQKTMSYTTSNPADGDRLLIYGLVRNDYWQMEIPTKGLAAGTVLNIEGAMQSSGTGPRDFLIQYSSDQSSWTPVNPVTEGDVTYTVQLGNAVRTPISETFTLENAIPQGTLYIRFLISGSASAAGGTVGAGGSSRVNRPQYTGDEDKVPIMKVTKL